MFDQVYYCPASGNSITPNLLIASLKAIIMLGSPPGLFLFSGLLNKLKSPTMSHDCSSGIIMFLNHLKKSSFLSGKQGA
jgi:hypothetical protein